MAETKMRIKTISIYPIKSLRGCTLQSLTANPTGFAYDRRFTLQRLSDGKHMSVGKVYEMCLFTTELSPPEHPEKILVRYTRDHIFNKPDEKVEDEVLEVPLEPDWKSGGLVEREVNMHSSPTVGFEMPAKYNEWFTKRFGYPVALMYVGENRRKVLGSVTPHAKALAESNNKANQGWFGAAKASVGSLIGSVAGYGENKENEDAEYMGVDQGIGWADVAPFLMVSDKSYQNAASRLSKEDLDIFKFRPNLVIEGADEAFEEDFWAEVAIGDAGTRIVLTANCARCASINVDYETGKQSGGEAGSILKLLQKDRRVDPGMKYSPIFGRYGFLASKGPLKGDGEVELKVGDTVTVVRRNEERTRFQWPGLSTDKD